MIRPLALLTLAARHGRLLLVLGLVAGVLLPGAALAMKPWLPEMVALLLFLAALRVGPERVAGSLRRGLSTLGLVLVYQLAMPLAVLGLGAALGVADTPVVLALTLMLAAPSISGSPSLAILCGADPAPAFRLLVLGTALLPLTVIPVLYAMPALGEGGAVLRAAGRLLFVIAIAAVAALALRQTVLRDPDAAVIGALDGASAITMAVLVVGLMSAVGPALASAPGVLLGWLAVAMAANFGVQIAAAMLLRRAGAGPALPAEAIVAGNRNIALFLVALSPEATDAVLIFIGCYQIPMYTTPLVLSPLYARWSGR